MSLVLCQRCQEHHLVNQTCPNCQKRNPSYMLPLAMLLGIGCKKNAAEPEVMALYGGPPVEEPVEIPSSTEVPEGTDGSESSDSQAPVETPVDQSNESNGSENETVQKIRPEREIMALYGAPPMEPIRVESLEKSKDDSTEATEENATDSEDE